jgi:RNA polymerase sigma factor (sigma-70 family)
MHGDSEAANMSEGEADTFLHHIRHLIGSAPGAALSDGELLEQFLSHRDESAVEVLVHRYGPLVFGVCRRVLREPHAAEDVFQATFCVLIRKAPVLDRGKPLGGWLYTVAYRLALTARANERRRQRCEEQAARRRSECEEQPATVSDLEAALDEELQRLPEKHRAALLLCYLEGKTNEQAARILGCPLGSMSARLNQARQRLRECLARRGYPAATAALAAALDTAGAHAVPLPLVCSTVRSAVWFAGEQAASAAVISAEAVALAQGACRAMFLNKVKIAAAVLLLTALLGHGARMLLTAAPPSPPTQAVLTPPDIPDAPLPDGVTARLGTVQLRHGDAVYFAAYTPDGKSLLTAGRDETIRLWDLATGKEVHRFAWGARLDGPAELSPDDTFEKEQRQMLHDLALSSQVALSRDGTTVAASRGGAVRLWQTKSGARLHDLQTGQKRLVHLAFSADGKVLLTVGPSGLAVAFWEVATGTCLRSTQTTPPAGYDRSGFVPYNEQDAVVSPGLKYLAYQWREPSGVRRIHVRELATGKELPPIHLGGYGGSLAWCFSADESTLMWVDWYPAGGVVFTDVATGKEVRRLGDRRTENGPDAGYTEVALALVASPDGKSLAVCRQSHTIELWDLKTGQLTYPVGRPTQAQLRHWFPDFVGAHVRPALTFSGDGKALLSSLGGAAVRQFHVETGTEVAGPGGPASRAAVWSVALSADGKSLCTFGSGEPIRTWDWAAGKETRREGLPATATHAVFAAEGRVAFAVGNEVTVRAKGRKNTWRIAEGEFPPLMALALSPDGELLATRNYDSPQVTVWDAGGKRRRTLARAGEGPTFTADGNREVAGVVTPDLVFSPDGRYLAGAGARWQLCLWEADTGNVLWEVLPQTGQVVERFAFSPGGHMLASLQADGTVTLYEAASGALRTRLGEADRKTQRVYLAYDYYGKVRLSDSTRRAAPVCLAFSPNGRYLATAQQGPIIRLWDVLAGREVGRLRGHEGGVVSLLFSRDGKHLFSGGTDTTVLTWDTARLTQPPPARADLLPAQKLESLWADLAGSNAARAFTAMRELAARPDQAVTLIKERVAPATPPDGSRMAQLVGELSSDRFGDRRQAQAQLQTLGELAGPALRQALAEGPPLEVRQRLERLLSRVAATPPDRQLRELRAVELLEWIGGPAARQVLEGLAGGAATARLTRQASSAGHRLGQLRAP